MGVKVVWSNVWTSKGKFLRDAELPELPSDEVETLKKAGAVEVKRGRKKGVSDAK